MEIYSIRTSCRLCGSSKLDEILSLGDQCISAFVEEETQPILAPLTLVICKECDLVQLKHSVNPSILYTDNYGYKTGLNSTMIQEVTDIRDAILPLKRLETGDLVVDIGSNDATLLKLFPDEVIKVGFEPVKKFKSDYAQGGLYNIPEFFNKEAYLKKFPKHKAQVITAISMFYDLDDPFTFLDDITYVLKEDGILVIQQNYLVRMIQNCAFDNICHEHASYQTLSTLQRMLAPHNLEVFKVEETTINGGSFRAFICFRGQREIEGSVREFEEVERKLKLNQLPIYIDFAKKVTKSVTKLKEFVQTEREKGKTFWVLAASTRGNVLLQAAGLNYPIVEGVSERNPEKWGKRTLGTNIPIYSEQEARDAKPDYMIVMPYWFRAELNVRERDFLQTGGSLVYPLPVFEVIGKEEK